MWNDESSHHRDIKMHYSIAKAINKVFYTLKKYDVLWCRVSHLS